MAKNHNTLPPKSRGYQVRDEALGYAVGRVFGELDDSVETVEVTREDIRKIAGGVFAVLGTSGLINREAADRPPLEVENV